MERQLRVLIDDTNQRFAIDCADALRIRNVWAIIRSHEKSQMIDAVRREHPDILILPMLSAEPDSMDFSYLPEIRALTDILVIGVMYQQQLQMCRRLVDSEVSFYAYDDNIVVFADHVCSSQADTDFIRDFIPQTR